MTEALFTTEDLRRRWNKKTRFVVRRLIHRYADILEPMKIGRELMIYPENVIKFEEAMRIIKGEE